MISVLEYATIDAIMAYSNRMQYSGLMSTLFFIGKHPCLKQQYTSTSFTELACSVFSLDSCMLYFMHRELTNGIPKFNLGYYQTAIIYF